MPTNVDTPNREYLGNLTLPQWTAMAMDLIAHHGWRILGDPPSLCIGRERRNDPKPEIIFIELATEHGPVSTERIWWMSSWQANGMECAVYRPGAISDLTARLGRTEP